MLNNWPLGTTANSSFRRIEKICRVDNINLAGFLIAQHFCFQRIGYNKYSIVYRHYVITPVLSCLHGAFYTMRCIEAGNIKLVYLCLIRILSRCELLKASSRCFVIMKSGTLFSRLSKTTPLESFANELLRRFTITFETSLRT